MCLLHTVWCRIVFTSILYAEEVIRARPTGGRINILSPNMFCFVFVAIVACGFLTASMWIGYAVGSKEHNFATRHSQ